MNTKRQTSEIEISIVMPCLNEADTIEVCVRKAMQSLEQEGIQGEVILADNGSTDGSQSLAQRLGARVVHVAARGYGNALMGGIAAARGRAILMGDADDSYDFLQIPRFVEGIRAGYEMVQGCRLPSGGGTVLPNAMPFTHRWFGNPVFSVLSRWWFNAPIHDVYCGMRAFTRELYDKLDLRCTGMEFATEMIIKASLYKARIAEVPITLHPDGRKTHPSHLRTFRDGWRTLRFLLMYCPRWLFFLPGTFLLLMGLLGYGLVLGGARLGGIVLDAHTLLFSSVAILCGYQAVFFAVVAKLFAVRERLLPEDPRFMRLFDFLKLERGLLIGMTGFMVGVGLLAWAVNLWRMVGFGALDYAYTMRWVISGATLTALGFQTVLSSFLLSLVGMHRR
jgi:glycosyltransferase involved in cell wall biosynthesis